MKKKLVALIACITVLVSGCGDTPAQQIADTVKEAAESIQSSSTPTPTETPAPVAKELKLGEKANVGDWKITVKKAEKKKKIANGTYRYFDPGKGNIFICINASVRNNGKKEDTFLPRIGYENKAVTATLYYKDYEYQPTELLGYDKNLVAERIKPLTTKSGTIAFAVPKKIAKSLKDFTLKIGIKDDSVIYKLK